MQVVRVENAQGEGPYRARRSPAWNLSDMNWDTHPTPSADAGLSYWWDNLDYRECGKYVFAFRDTNQLSEWFYKEEWVYELRESGFALATYEVPSPFVRVGERQAVFIRDHSHLLAIEIPMPSHQFA